MRYIFSLLILLLVYQTATMSLVSHLETYQYIRNSLTKYVRLTYTPNQNTLDDFRKE